MSIYGGFPTRALESCYNQLLTDIIYLLQNFVLATIKTTKLIILPNFTEDFCRSYQKLVKFEKQKHMLPKYSDYIKELDDHLKSFNSDLSYRKNSERNSLPTNSTGSFNRDLEKNQKYYYKSRQSCAPNSKSRDSDYKSNNYPVRYKKTADIKVYQDQILKSILKDLSTPHAE